jgi:predicted permease
MKKSWQQVVLLLLLLIFSFGLFSFVNTSYAANGNVTGQMINAIGGVSLPSGGKDKTSIENNTTAIIGRAISAFLSLFGIIFLILTVYGGYKWMIASGREEEVKSAKDIIRAAVIGLVIVLMSYAITFFVVTSIQSATIK